MDHNSGGFRLPIPTDDIIRMIEAEAEDLELYADLSENVDGYTDYLTDRNPDVKISERLASSRYVTVASIARLSFTIMASRSAISERHGRMPRESRASAFWSTTSAAVGSATWSGPTYRSG